MSKRIWVKPEEALVSITVRAYDDPTRKSRLETRAKRRIMVIVFQCICLTGVKMMTLTDRSTRKEKTLTFKGEIAFLEKKSLKALSKAES